MNHWLFFRDPKEFMLDEYLASRKIVFWAILEKFVNDEIAVNDIVFFWRLDGNITNSGGIIAKGKVIGLPAMCKDDAILMWRTEKENTFELRTRIKIEDVRLNKEQGMLKGMELKKNAATKNLNFLQICKSVNYRLEPPAAMLLEEQWKKNVLSL